MLTDEQLERLGQSLRSYREAQNLTQTQVAVWAGLNRTSISDFETGASCMSIHSLVRVADAIGADPSDIIRDANL